MDIWGLCPKCDKWWAVPDWFDDSVPTPTCPTCKMAPAKLEYVLPSQQPSESWVG